MTKEEAWELVDSLSDEEVLILRELLLSLRQNHAPVEDHQQIGQ